MTNLSEIFISITIPTIKLDITNQIDLLKQNISSNINYEIIIVNQQKSAAINRNACIEKAQGSLIIMIDDDIWGFYDNWIYDLIKPLLENPEEYSIITPRLVDPNYKYVGQLGDCSNPNIPNEEITIAKHTEKTGLNIIGSSCIAFFKNDIRFDEKYIGATYEDADFCMMMNQQYPDKKNIINNKCKLIHMGEAKGRIINGDSVSQPNKEYFKNKWGVEI